MKIQILKSTQVNGKHCEILDVVEVEQAMANYLIDAKRAIAFKEYLDNKNVQEKR